MEGGSVKELKSKAELNKILAEKKKKAVILHFWASWCEASKQMDQVFSHLSTNFPHAHFFRAKSSQDEMTLIENTPSSTSSGLHVRVEKYRTFFGDVFFSGQASRVGVLVETTNTQETADM